MTNKTVVVGLFYYADFLNDTINIVSSKKDTLMLPQIDLSTINPKKNNITLDNINKLLFEKCVNLNFNWAKPKLINIELSYDDENNYITTIIYFATYVPNNVELLNNLFFIDIKPYVAHYETLRKLICML